MQRTKKPTKPMRRTKKAAGDLKKIDVLPHGGYGGHIPDPPSDCLGFIHIYGDRRYVDVSTCKNKCKLGMAKNCMRLKEYYRAWKAYWEEYAKVHNKYAGGVFVVGSDHLD
jgi:hypothetical protein